MDNVIPFQNQTVSKQLNVKAIGREINMDLVVANATLREGLDQSAAEINKRTHLLVAIVLRTGGSIALTNADFEAAKGFMIHAEKSQLAEGVLIVSAINKPPAAAEATVIDTKPEEPEEA